MRVAGDFSRLHLPGAMRAAQPCAAAAKTQGILEARASCPRDAEKNSLRQGLKARRQDALQDALGAWGILNHIGASAGIWLPDERIPQADQGHDPDAPRCPGTAGKGIWGVSGAETAMRAAQISGWASLPHAGVHA